MTLAEMHQTVSIRFAFSAEWVRMNATRRVRVYKVCVCAQRAEQPKHSKAQNSPHFLSLARARASIYVIWPQQATAFVNSELMKIALSFMVMIWINLNSPPLLKKQLSFYINEIKTAKIKNESSFW